MYFGGPSWWWAWPGTRMAMNITGGDSHTQYMCQQSINKPGTPATTSFSTPNYNAAAVRQYKAEIRSRHPWRVHTPTHNTTKRTGAEFQTVHSDHLVDEHIFRRRHDQTGTVLPKPSDDLCNVDMLTIVARVECMVDCDVGPGLAGSAQILDNERTV